MSETKSINGVECTCDAVIQFETSEEIQAFVQGMELGGRHKRDSDSYMYRGDLAAVEWDVETRQAKAWYVSERSHEDEFVCDECGEWIPDSEPEPANKHHADWCSLHHDNPGDDA